MPMRLKVFVAILWVAIGYMDGLCGTELLDSFDTTAGWKIIASDAVSINTDNADGYEGRGIRFDYEFTAGTGYCGIQKQFPMLLPENYEFSFYIRADVKVNNLEFKILDSSGDNVWWYVFRNYEFPREWRKITIKKRDIQFAWGPAEDRTLRSFDKIEFIMSSVHGGAGTMYIDELMFVSKPLPVKPMPNPLIIVSSSSKSARFLMDNDPQSVWRSSQQADVQRIDIDLNQVSEFGGLVIDWDLEDYGKNYDVLISNDGSDWEVIYRVTCGKGGRSYISLRDSEARYIRLQLNESSRGKGYAIGEISIRDINFSTTPEKFFTNIAADHPRGYFPRYLYNEQSYWTIAGVAGDPSEALINEEGMVEVDKQCFSIEPFLYYDDMLVTWDDVQTLQSLEKGYLPIPCVTWKQTDFRLDTKLFAHGKPDHSILYITYDLKNTSGTTIEGNLYLAIRPFQVNPPWQFLNFPGGTAKIESIVHEDHCVSINDTKKIYCLSEPNGFGALEFDQGDVSGYIAKNKLPDRQHVHDHFGYASGLLRFTFMLEPDSSQTFFIAVPFHDDVPQFTESDIIQGLNEVVCTWESKLNAVRFGLPSSATRLVNSIRSNLAYILINQDHAGIQPGSRSYERSWIRDGSMTSTALSKMGITEEPKKFYDWYSRFQYDNGKIPCVVDFRGPDPVPENDSNGEFIYGIYQYFKFSHDTTFLREKFAHVRKAVDYLDYLVSQRSTDDYANGDDEIRAFYGILPESISHEGYSAKPMHSYWDNFWAMRGFKDAVKIAKILKEEECIARFTRSRDTFRKNLYESLDLAIRNRGINYIPGCVELGDFDATSTAIAVYPCLELGNLPAEPLQNTFKRYDEYFIQRMDPSHEWLNYTPYEIRVVAAYLVMDAADKAQRMLDFFYADQRPGNWNHWAEVVWKDERRPEFIGDMPHTWVGSEFITAARLMFVMEEESNDALIVGQGLPPEWIDYPGGISVTDLPTHYGRLSYSFIKTDHYDKIQLSGDLVMPAGQIKLRNIRRTIPREVLINDRASINFDSSYITVSEFPAVIKIFY